MRRDSIQELDENELFLGIGRVATIEVNENMPVYDLHPSDGAIDARYGFTTKHARQSRTKFLEPRCGLGQLQEDDWIRPYR